MKNKLNILIIFFGLAKLLLHFFTNTNYGLHRDEFLYFDEGQHLSWGFMEVPPFTPFIGKITELLGGSVFAIRLFPALTGVMIVLLSGFFVKRLGGREWGIIFTCSALLFSPALLWSNTLFQPVSFNQFFWFLIAFWLIKILRFNDQKAWIYLGFTVGLAFLNKYSVVFYLIALLIAIVLSSHRKIFTNKKLYVAILIGLIISAPNLLWQFNHNFPVVGHMQTLSENQLVNIDWWHFISSQFIFHGGWSLIWISGLIGLFFINELKSLRFLASAFLITFLIIGALSGKSYYTLGSFLILFSFGGIVLEKLIKTRWARYSIMGFLILSSIVFLPYSLPILKIEAMKNYCKVMKESIGFDAPLRWEDGKYYALPQDMADMNGWEELAQRVSKIYHGLPQDIKDSCNIYGGGYAHAGSINFFRKKYDLPEVYSLNSSYIMWIPTNVEFTNQIMIDDQVQTSSNWFESMTLVDSIQDPYARDPGYIYYRENPKIDVNTAWRELVEERKDKYNFK